MVCLFRHETIYKGKVFLLSCLYQRKPSIFWDLCFGNIFGMQGLPGSFHVCLLFSKAIVFPSLQVNDETLLSSEER